LAGRPRTALPGPSRQRTKPPAATRLKGVELANLVIEHLGDIIRAAHAVHAGIVRIRRAAPNLA
jgi:hypothetical protein